MRIPIVLAAALLAAGCSSAGDGAAAPASPTASPTATPAASPTASRVPARTPPRVAPPPARTTPPVTVDAPCPYASADVVAQTVGQRIARTTVTRTRPHPGCGYYRANGEKAVDVAVSVQSSVVAARTRAIRIPGPTANPVDRVADGGTVALTADGSVLAVSKGATLVVVRTNLARSLEAVEIAKLVVARI